MIILPLVDYFSCLYVFCEFEICEPTRTNCFANPMIFCIVLKSRSYTEELIPAAALAATFIYIRPKNHQQRYHQRNSKGSSKGIANDIIKERCYNLERFWLRPFAKFGSGSDLLLIVPPAPTLIKNVIIYSKGIIGIAWDIIKGQQLAKDIIKGIAK